MSVQIHVRDFVTSHVGTLASNPAMMTVTEHVKRTVGMDVHSHAIPHPLRSLLSVMRHVLPLVAMTVLGTASVKDVDHSVVLATRKPVRQTVG